MTIVLMLSLTAAVSVNIYMTKSNYDKGIRDEIKFLTTYYEREFNNYIENQVQNLEHVINSREFDTYLYNVQDKLIKELFKNYHDSFPIIYFITKENGIVTNSKYPVSKVLMQKKDEYSKKLYENPNHIFVSSIEYSELLKKPVVIFSVLKRNYFNENIGMFFSMSPIDSFVPSTYMELKKDFTIRVIDNNGYIASSSKANEIMKKLQYEDTLKANTLFKSTVMDEKSCCYIKETAYGKIIITYPSSDFKELISSYIQINIIIYLIILLIAFILTFIFSKSVTKPLEYLLHQIEEYTKGNYTKKIKLQTNDEISVLANSFNSLGNELELKRAELLDINKNLERKVAKEVEKNLHKEQLLMKKSRLASIAGIMDAVAHQWKQPLSVIRISSSNLKFQNELEGEVSSELINKTTDDIELQIEHLLETIDEFRKFFRPDEKKEIVSLKKLIESVLQINSNMLMNNKINITVDIDEDIQYDIFLAEFKHVFINFINNARDAFIENNIKDRKLIFNCCENDSNITISVTDNAGGIPKEIIDTIFDANITTKKDGKGTGIGLYMSKQIVEKINGVLSVENVKFNLDGEQQKGARFKIILIKNL